MAHYLSGLHLKLAEYAAETMVYFERHKLIEIAKQILIECALERPSDVQTWIGKNIKRIAAAIRNDCLNQVGNGIIASLHLSSHFLYRLVIFGRPGSGRKTQALYLVKRFNLVLLDAEILICQHLKGSSEHANDPLDRELQRAFYYDNCAAKGKALANIIARRILEKDCLTQGWILLNFPHTLIEFQEILENFKIPPNKIIYLQCAEKICMRRLIAMPDMGQPNKSCAYFQNEMHHFNRNEMEIANYLKRRQEVVFIKADKCSQVVKNELFTLIEKSPYLMGFKENVKD